MTLKLQSLALTTRPQELTKQHGIQNLIDIAGKFDQFGQNLWVLAIPMKNPHCARHAAKHSAQLRPKLHFY